MRSNSFSPPAPAAGRTKALATVHVAPSGTTIRSRLWPLQVNVPVPRPAEFVTSMVPPLCVTPPEKVFAPVSVNVPLPCLTRPPLPTIEPE
jgi:hypothetical protein